MKRRAPATLSSATRHIVEALGHKKAKEIVHRSSALIYKWTDPDLAFFPNLEQALALDAEFVKSGHGAPPLLAAYTALLRSRLPRKAGKHLASILPDTVNIVDAACRLLGDICDQIQVIEQTRKPPKRCEICRTLRQISEMQSALSWRMEEDPSEQTCPLRRPDAGRIECSIGKRADRAPIGHAG